MKRAFSMVELIFVIVILGILGTVAIAKIAATRDDALISKISQRVSVAINEIADHAVARKEIDANLTRYSNTLATMVAEGNAREVAAQNRVEIRAGDVADCIVFAVVRGARETNLTISYGNNANADPVCGGVQNYLNLSNFPIVLRGHIVKY